VTLSAVIDSGIEVSGPSDTTVVLGASFVLSTDKVLSSSFVSSSFVSASALCSLFLSSGMVALFPFSSASFSFAVLVTGPIVSPRFSFWTASSSDLRRRYRDLDLIYS
jgi:hypothetical protein